MKENFMGENKILRMIKKHEKKDAILHFFKQADKYYDFLKKFERKIKKKKYNSSFQKKFDCAQEKIIREAYSIERDIRSFVEIRKIRDIFRQKTGRFIFRSKIIKYSYTKPRGYPGDCFIFEIIYNNKPISTGIGYYLDKWVLQHFLTIGVKYRKDTMINILEKHIRKSNSNLAILNIGCGSCKEIRELLSKKNIFFNKISFSCIDQDDVALNMAKRYLKIPPENVSVEFIRRNVIAMMGLVKENHLHSYDIVYSLGVADYFLKNGLGLFIKYCHGLLKRDGILIIPLCSSYDPKINIHLRWFCDWNIFIHDPRRLTKFIKTDVGIKKVKIIWEKRGPIFFIIIKN